MSHNLSHHGRTVVVPASVLPANAQAEACLRMLRGLPSGSPLFYRGPAAPFQRQPGVGTRVKVLSPSANYPKLLACNPAARLRLLCSFANCPRLRTGRGSLTTIRRNAGAIAPNFLTYHRRVFFKFLGDNTGHRRPMKRGIFAAPMTTVTADDKILTKFCSLSPPEMPLFMGQLGLPGPYGPREAQKGKRA